MATQPWHDALARSEPRCFSSCPLVPVSRDVRSDLRRRIQELNIGYIVVHPQMMDTERLRAVVELLASIDRLIRLDTSADVVAFA